MRITIIGLPGSGKSTLARLISQKLHIPHIHLDRFWFEAGGRQGPHDTPNIDVVRAHIKESVLKSIAAENWVSDGLYARVQDEIALRADTLIYLDIPLWRRLANHTARILSRVNRHAEVSLWDDLRFFLEIIKRTFTNKSKIQTILEKYPHKMLVLRSRQEIEKYFDGLI